jgi:hypothetical protein
VSFLPLSSNSRQQRAKQPCAPAPPSAYIGAPSTFGHVDSATTEKASEATTVDNTISSSDNVSEEGGGHGVDEA